MNPDDIPESERATGDLLPPANGSGSQAHGCPSAAVRVDLAAQTHKGHLRSNNGDHFLTVRITRSLETLATSLPADALQASFDEVAYGMVVADGMGEAAGGAVASSIALLKLIELGVQTSDWVMKLSEQKDTSTVMNRMTHRFRRIDEALRAEAVKDPELFGMGTTLTVAISLGQEILVGHIGDSRAYLLRNEKLFQLTRDHTLAQALIDAGITQPQDTTTVAMRRVLTAALGANADHMDAQVQRFHLNDGDQILLCTDGLTEMVPDADIASVCLSSGSAEKASQSLVDLALAGGGLDNITAVLARYHFPTTTGEEAVPPRPSRAS
jgi:protein phosphatase